VTVNDASQAVQRNGLGVTSTGDLTSPEFSQMLAIISIGLSCILAWKTAKANFPGFTVSMAEICPSSAQMFNLLIIAVFRVEMLFSVLKIFSNNFHF
jgi:hypothetical protein